MTKPLTICLRGGERLYINGAVLRVDRKVSIEVLNDVTFLLEHHVMKPEDTKTPLRQLYFIVQTIVIDPANASSARMMFETSHTLLLSAFKNEQVLAGLHAVRDLVEREKLFEALKLIRSLFPIEDAILGADVDAERKKHLQQLPQRQTEVQAWT